MPWFWQGTAVLFAAFAGVGAIIGLAASLILKLFHGRISRTTFSSAAVGFLSLAFSVNLLLQPELQRSDLLGAAIGFLLAVNSGIMIWSPSWERRFGFLGGPFTASLLLLVAPWLRRTLFPPDTPWNEGTFLPSSAAAKWAALLVAICLIALAANLGARISKRIGSQQGLFPRPQFMMTFLGLALMGAALGVAFNRDAPPALPQSSAAAAARPNVLFVSLDTVRADHMSVYGYERATTPNLQTFAQDASVYDHAISVADMTLASHASMFTGQYPRRHGAHYQPSQPLGQAMPNVPTLAELLSANGYASAGVVANYAYLHPLFGFQRGFQRYDYRAPVQLFDPNDTFYLRNAVRRAADLLLPMEQFDRLCRSAGEINSEVFPMLQELAQQKNPFFLFVNYMDTHAPRMPPAPFKDRFPGRDPRMTSQSYYATVKDVMRQKRHLSLHERESMLALYDGSMAYLDDQVGQLILQLKKLGVYENTLIVITSDHGEAFGERDLMEHSVSVYQDQISVPLMIKFPQSHEGRRVEETVSHVDLLPTILSVAGLPLPQGIQGIDVRQPTAGRSRTVMSESFRNAMFVDWNKRFNRTESAIISGTMKLILSTTGKRELYDLALDPDERTNLEATTKGVATDLSQQLTAWIKAVAPPAQAQAASGRGNIQRLKSLGYVQ